MSKLADISVYSSMTADELYQAALADADTCSEIFHSSLATQLSIKQRKALIQTHQQELHHALQTMTTNDDLDAISSLRFEMLIHKLAAANEVDKLKELAKKNLCAALYLLGMQKFSDENKFNLIIEYRDHPAFAEVFTDWLPKDFIYHVCKEDPYKLNLVCHYSILLDQLSDEQLDELLIQHQLFLLHAISSPNYPKASDKILQRLQAIQSKLLTSPKVLR